MQDLQPLAAAIHKAEQLGERAGDALVDTTTKIEAIIATYGLAFTYMHPWDALGKAFDAAKHSADVAVIEAEHALEAARGVVKAIETAEANSHTDYAKS